MAEPVGTQLPVPLQVYTTWLLMLRPYDEPLEHISCSALDHSLGLSAMRKEPVRVSNVNNNKSTAYRASGAKGRGCAWRNGDRDGIRESAAIANCNQQSLGLVHRMNETHH